MIKSMDVVTLKEKLDQKENILLVDCREQAEWNEAHIDGAKFIPLSDFQNQHSELPKDATIIMQCRSGKRSMNACQFLQDQGYEDLTNLEGGILAWIDQGYEVES